MPPAIVSSDALVIWILRIAMKEPIIAASTAIHVVRLALSEASAGTGATWRGAGILMTFDIFEPSPRQSVDAVLSGGDARLRQPGIDRGCHRHAGPQIADQRTAGVKADPDRNALNDLCDVAGGIVRRQQCDLLTAGGRDAVDMTLRGLGGV